MYKIFIETLAYVLYAHAHISSSKHYCTYDIVSCILCILCIYVNYYVCFMDGRKED